MPAMAQNGSRPPTISKTVTIFLPGAAFSPTLQELDWFQRIGTRHSTDLINNRILEVIMKSLISAVVIATALVVPVVSFAQQADGLTRAQVRAELVTAQKAGLLNQNDVNYPKTVPQSGTAVATVARGSHDVGGVKAVSSDAGTRDSLQQGLFATYRGQ
jgi:hypothetical protein